MAAWARYRNGNLVGGEPKLSGLGIWILDLFEVLGCWQKNSFAKKEALLRKKELNWVELNVLSSRKADFKGCSDCWCQDFWSRSSLAEWPLSDLISGKINKLMVERELKKNSLPYLAVDLSLRYIDFHTDRKSQHHWSLVLLTCS